VFLHQRGRVCVFLFLCVALTACDSYIEEARVQRDGSVEFVARAVVVCTDPLQQELWDDEPCVAIDSAIRTGDIGELPFDFSFDPDRVSLVGSGEADRRTVDATWNGTVDEFSTVLVSSGAIRAIDEQQTEAVFVPVGAPDDQLRDSTDPDLVDALRSSRWNPAEFRVKAPDLIVDHNGDQIQGRLVIWNLDGDHPDEFRVVWTTEDPPRRLWWWLLGSVILFVVLFLMITIEGPARERQRR